MVVNDFEPRENYYGSIIQYYKNRSINNLHAIPPRMILMTFDYTWSVLYMAAVMDGSNPGAAYRMRSIKKHAVYIQFSGQAGTQS